MKEIKVGKITIGDPNKTIIQGVINLSPESFYKGSIKTNIDEIVSTAKRMESNGAQIIDVGAMSTAPYLETQISPEKEKERVVDGISEIAKEINIPVSIDTTRASTAEAALENGAELVNDISGFTSDDNLPKVIKEYNVPVIIGAYKIERFIGSPVKKVIQALQSSMEIGEKAGVPRENFILDPDIGFHRKTEYEWYEIDSHLLANLQIIIEELNQPVCVGVSRKSFIGHLLQIKDAKNRLFGSLGATGIAVLNGANIIRTHDVKETTEAIRIIEKILAISKTIDKK